MAIKKKAAKKAAKKKPGKHYHEAGTGRMVTKKYAEEHKNTTVGISTKKAKKKAKK